jgi:hypothetical protein
MLVFHEALWFGHHKYELYNSLINPNQCRAYGVSICDDPFDKNRPLGLHDPVSGITIPFEMHGSIAGFTTRAPQEQEIRTCRHIVLCDNAPWDPSKIRYPKGVTFTNTSESDYAIAKVQAPVERQLIVQDVPVMPYIEMDTCSHEFTNRCISTIRVTLSAVNSSGRHSRTTAEELARKWKISLEAAKRTMKCTTQLAVRHAKYPLRRRYWTGMHGIHHKRLRTRMYTDTLFSRVISINGYKCVKFLVWVTSTGIRNLS